MAEILSEFGHLVGTASGNIQVATMPAYTSVPLGTIVQYIGTTTADYINGYFYKATASGWEVVDVQGEDTDKADKVSGATNGNLAELDANGNLADSGIASDIFPSGASSSDKLVKASENNFKYQVSASGTDFNNLINPGVYSVNVTGRTAQHSPEMYEWYQVYVTNANNNTADIQQMAYHYRGNIYTRIFNSVTSTWSTWDRLVKLSEMSAKADKVVPTASGSFAQLDSSGNLVDSGLYPTSYIFHEADFFLASGGYCVITFSGTAIGRTAHYLLFLCEQNAVATPIVIAFVNDSGWGTGNILDILISNNINGQIVISGTSIYIPQGMLGGWGRSLLFNLLPQENVSYTITEESSIPNS